MLKSKSAIVYLQQHTYMSWILPLLPELQSRGIEHILILGRDFNKPDHKALADKAKKLRAVYLAPDWRQDGPDGLLLSISEAFNIAKPNQLQGVPRCPRKVRLSVDAQSLSLFMLQEECRNAVTRYSYSMAVAATVIKMLNAHILITDMDFSFFDTACWVYSIQRCGGIAVSVGSHTHKTFDVYSQSKRPYATCYSKMSHFVEKYFPKWTKIYEGKKVFLLPAHEVLAMEVLGIAPPLPWVWDSGYLDSLCIENQYGFDRTLQLYPEMQKAPLALTGSCTHDVLYNFQRDREKYRKEYFQQHNLDESKPTLLVNLLRECSAYHFPTDEFSTYIECVHTLLNVISANCHYNIIVSLHPTTNPEHKKLLQSSRWILSYEGAASLLHLCDRLISSESTVDTWALALGLPVLNYRLIWKHLEFRYNVPQAAGMRVVSTLPEFITTLKVLNRSGNWEALAQEARKHIKYWGNLDGHSVERIVDEIFFRLNSKTLSTRLNISSPHNF